MGAILHDGETFRVLNEKMILALRLSLYHGVCYRCVELHLKLEENMWF